MENQQQTILNSNKLIPIDEVLTLMVAGNFTFTVTSVRTEDYYTFNVKLNEESDYYEWTVSVLDKHTNKFVEIGNLEYDEVFNFISKNVIHQDIAIRAFTYLLHVCKCGFKGLFIQVRPVGKCCRCGRRLTTPDSIEKMIGPECEKEHKEFIQSIINQV